MSGSTVRFVELVRVSTDAQDARDTPQIQRTALDELRVRRPGVLVERLECAVSGNAAISERSDLRRLAELTDLKSYNEIRIWRLDRLTRSEWLADAGVPFDLGRKVGALIVDCTGDTIDTRSGIGRLLYQIKSSASADEREKIRDRTYAGKKRAAEQGRLPSGPTPYALRWDRVARVWSIDEQEAAVYRRAFAECLSGKSLRTIAGGLRAERVPSRKGGVWCASTVHRMLTNPAATGRWDILGFALDVPAIVDRQTFEAAQAKMRQGRLSGGPRVRYPVLLRRLLTCGVCGQSVSVESRNVDRHGTRATYYACSSAGAEIRGPRHPVAYRRTEDVDAAVRCEIEQLMSDPALARAAVAKMTRTPEHDWAADAKKASDEDRKLAMSEASILDLLEAGHVSRDQAAARLDSLKARRQEAQARAAEANRQAAASRMPLREVGQIAGLVSEGLRTASTERAAELVGLIFPRQPPYGLRLYADRVEGVGRLSLVSVASRSGRHEGQAPPEAAFAFCAAVGRR